MKFLHRPTAKYFLNQRKSFTLECLFLKISSILIIRNLNQPRYVKFHESSHTRCEKSHYDTLELTSKATKNDIKKAYYRLSLKFHPDQNKGNEESSEKFRKISEAYEVLGDVEKRRRYDLGHNIGHFNFEAKTSQYHSNLHRYAPSNYKKVYDMDEWMTNHYSTSFHKSQRARRYRNSSLRYNNTSNSFYGPFHSLFSFLIFFVIISIIFSEFTNYDQPYITYKKDLKKK